MRTPFVRPENHDRGSGTESKTPVGRNPRPGVLSATDGTVRLRTMVILIAVFAVVGGTVTWVTRGSETPVPAFQTATITRGDLQLSIGATGTVEPEEVIDVGAQVAGQILSFGNDVNGKRVDYGSVVDKGTVLARIDDSVYAAQEAQSEAQVQSARAGLAKALADLEQLKAKFDQASRDWQRAKTLGTPEALSQASFDAYRSAYESTRANVAVGQAAVLQARAGIAQAEAGLRQTRRNLGYCTIISPVKGVIIDRRVNIGQTVVASLNAPSLFLIAKDLHHMQVWVAVNEADIGKVHPGQPVTFTVDAFPGEIFPGEVGKIRLNASMTQNVVTYTVEILTDNSSGRLLPYLTANVQFELSHRRNVLLVPNAALRWKPKSAQIAPAHRGVAGKVPSASRAPSVSKEGFQPGRLWVANGDFVRPLPVQVGVTDGTHTEVEGNGLTPGMVVVTGIETRPKGAAKEATTNPLAPVRFHSRGKGR